MVKTVFKILLSILFILLSIFFYKQKVVTNIWGNYTPVILQSQQDVDRAVILLQDLGFKDILYKEGITLGINNYTNSEERSLEEISMSLDKKDYRYDPFVSSIESLFSTSNINDSIVYIKLAKKDLVKVYNIYKSFNDNAIAYKLGNPVFLRIILNYISFFVLILLLGAGCKTRFIISLLTGVAAFFFMDASSVYSFTSFTIGYFLIIMVVESISFSNRYIKRNNIGFLRILLSIILFSIPTFSPTFLDFSNIIYTPTTVEGAVFDYESMEAVFEDTSANISNYLAHYTFQKSFLYGDKYLFPTKGNSVTIDEFKREDYYLSRYEKVVLSYDEVYLQDFISYCSTTALGRFYLDYGRPFKLELNSLLSLYIKEKEYMQIGIIASTMLIASFFFRKGRDKKLKY